MTTAKPFPEIGCVLIYPDTEDGWPHSESNPFAGWRWMQILTHGETEESELLPNLRTAQRAAETTFTNIIGWDPPKHPFRNYYAKVR